MDLNKAVKKKTLGKLKENKIYLFKMKGIKVMC